MYKNKRSAIASFQFNKIIHRMKLDSHSAFSHWRIFILFSSVISLATAVVTISVECVFDFSEIVKIEFVSFFDWQKVNITNVDNCYVETMKGSTAVVLLKDIQYQIVDGLCDTISGSYIIPTVNTADKLVNKDNEFAM